MLKGKLFKIFLVLVSALSVFAIGCEAKTETRETKSVSDETITRFSFICFESFGYGSYSYEIDTSEDVPMFYYSAFDYTGWSDSRNDYLKCEVDEKFLDDLNSFCREENVSEFDGFDGSNPDVLDGGGFSLGIYYDDGTYVYASGRNSYPEWYSGFRDKLCELFAPLEEKVIKEYIDSKRNINITGDLDDITISIVQHGDSGYNEYFFSVYENTGGTGNNLEYRINSRIEEEFPADSSYIHYSHEEDVSPVLDRFREIFDRYDLKTWNCYDETAEDYDNCEWFEFHFGFTSDQYVSAMGTEHPENYDSVRKEIMEVIKDTVEQYEQ
ncbi:MAG: hypothetical protein HUJ76_10140 [Parasporobacterium sp.]|nr:hypothetical protein [Parasporobacterium sp.]